MSLFTEATAHHHDCPHCQIRRSCWRIDCADYKEPLPCFACEFQPVTEIEGYPA